MTTSEPENGSHVAVKVTDVDVWPFRRDDQTAAEAGDPDRRWFLWSQLADGADRDDRTWAELTELGDIAYVGVFVNRGERGEA